MKKALTVRLDKLVLDRIDQLKAHLESRGPKIIRSRLVRDLVCIGLRSYSK